MIFDLSLIVKSKTWKVDVFLNIKIGFCFPFINSQGKHPGSSAHVIVWMKVLPSTICAQSDSS